MTQSNSSPVERAHQLALLSCLSAGAAVQAVAGHFAQDSRNSSILSGAEYVQELRNGHPAVFKSILGLNKHVFDKLLDILVEKGGFCDSKYLQMEEQLAIFLYIVTSGESNRKTQNRFQRSAETVSRCFHQIIKLLVSPSVYYAYVKLPRETDPTPIEIESNSKLYPFLKNCLGALDGSHFSAWVPAEDRPRYRNRKGFISQNVLAVVSFDMRFIYVLSRWEGSAADSMILEDARRNGFAVPRSKFYLGDAGFAASTSVLVPYRGVRYHLREWMAGNQKPQNKQELFNLRHSQARNVVERVFGVFKRRFRIFNSAPEYPIETQAALVQALCVVHNIIRIYDPMDVPSWNEDDIDDDGQERNSSNEYDQHQSATGSAERVAAENLRETIADEMWKSYVEIHKRRRRQRSQVQ